LVKNLNSSAYGAFFQNFHLSLIGTGGISGLSGTYDTTDNQEITCIEFSGQPSGPEGIARTQTPQFSAAQHVNHKVASAD
jgi:hypothetical protein